MAFFSSLTDDFRATSHSKPFCANGAMVPHTFKSLCSLTHDLRVWYSFHQKKGHYFLQLHSHFCSAEKICLLCSRSWRSKRRFGWISLDTGIIIFLFLGPSHFSNKFGIFAGVILEVSILARAPPPPDRGLLPHMPPSALYLTHKGQKQVSSSHLLCSKKRTTATSNTQTVIQIGGGGPVHKMINKPNSLTLRNCMGAFSRLLAYFKIW